MSDPLTIAGIVANIGQLVDFGIRITRRLDEYRSNFRQLPEVFEHVYTGLPLLISSLKTIKTEAQNGNISESAKKSLYPVIEGCLKQVKELDALLNEVALRKDDSKFRKTQKAFLSISYEEKVRGKSKVINNYVKNLTLYLQASSTRGHASTQVPMPTPSPRFICPFMRETDFVERDVMSKLMASNKPGTRHALYGLGGIGKSQILIEVGYRIEESEPQTWVFWVCCESVERLKADYRKIAKAVGIPSWDDKNVNILTLVYDWLSNKQNGPWVIMLDNADASDVFTAPLLDSESSDTSAQPKVLDFLPVSSHGSILITSRNRDTALALTFKDHHNFLVEPMTEVEAINLVKKKLGGNYIDDDIKQLVKALDYIPLVISQATAYISRRSPRVTITTYLQELKKEDEERQKLLETVSPELGRDQHRSNSIIPTWQLSFKYVRETKPSAARLLSLMCLFDCQNIPETLLIGNYGEKTFDSASATRESWRRLGRSIRVRRDKKKTPKPQSPITFQDDLDILHGLCLVKINADGNHFSMHALVQFTMKRWLSLHNELAIWIHGYLTLLKAHLLSAAELDTLEEKRLLVHACIGISQIDDMDFPSTLRIWADLVFKVAQYFENESQWTESAHFYRLACIAFRKSIYASAPEAIQSAMGRARALTHLDKYLQAEHVYRDVLGIQQKQLGYEHLETLDIMDILGDVLEKQKRNAEAEKFHVQALTTRLRTLGSAHQKYQSALKSHGLAQQRRGENAAAYETFRQLYDARRSCLSGQCSKRRAVPKKFPNKKKNKVAADILVSTPESHDPLSQAISEQIFGKDTHGQSRARALGYSNPFDYVNNLETLEVMFNLAIALKCPNKLTDLENLGREMMEKGDKIFRVTHTVTRTHMCFVADVLREQNRLEEARDLFYRTYLVEREVEGDESESTTHILRKYMEVKEKAAQLSATDIQQKAPEDGDVTGSMLANDGVTTTV